MVFPILFVISPFLWGAFSLYSGVKILRKKGDYFIGIPDPFSIEKICKEYIEKANIDKPTIGD